MAEQARARLGWDAQMSFSEVLPRRGDASEPEFANARLVEAEVVTDLVAHRLCDV
jgi:hypothetical protein